MTWLAVIALAVATFAIAAFGFGLSKGLWTSLAAALGFGLAGYALQASPEMAAAPKSAVADQGEQEFDIVEARREFVSLSDRSGSPMLVTSDAMARRGRYADAAQMLEGVTRQNPQDFEAWLAQAIALAEHADGNLSQASLYAFQRAANVKPENLAPGYFLGVSLIRQGRLMEAQQVWRETLENSPEDAEGRAGVADRLARLDVMLGAMQAGQMTMPPAAGPAAPAQSGD
ncbi:tetratricopeptide repeat protein [Aurantiacibacter odishensis]|uniref:tetratricopeptide repeat protein n=1 Tax=Aurantiacibacter odishensis TaxID=1155476 RepID=UPI000E70C63F|nr:cytochrome C biosynthesis protein [Aurantiacibacter odishensis]